jgi:hypothetical protein
MLHYLPRGFSISISKVISLANISGFRSMRQAILSLRRLSMVCYKWFLCNLLLNHSMAAGRGECWGLPWICYLGLDKHIIDSRKKLLSFLWCPQPAFRPDASAHPTWEVEQAHINSVAVAERWPCAGYVCAFELLCDTCGCPKLLKTLPETIPSNLSRLHCDSTWLGHGNVVDTRKFHYFSLIPKSAMCHI